MGLQEDYIRGKSLDKYYEEPKSGKQYKQVNIKMMVFAWGVCIKTEFPIEDLENYWKSWDKVWTLTEFCE